MRFSNKFIILGGGFLASVLFLSGCSSSPDQSGGSTNNNSVQSGADTYQPDVGYSGLAQNQNSNANPEINTEQGLAQPIAPLPANSKQAIDSEVKSINQDLDNLEANSNTNSDDGLGL